MLAASAPYRAAGWLFLVLVLVGCSGPGGVEQPTELTDFDASHRVEEVWSANAGGNAKRLYLGLRPATDGARVYMAGHDGRVQAVDTESGRRQWRVDLDAPLAGGPAVGQDRVLVGSLDGRLFALDADTGERIWTVRIGGEILAAPAVSGSYVVVKSTDGRVRGLSLSDGGELWSRSESVEGLVTRGDASPIIRGSRVFVGFANGQVRGVGLRSGEALWSVAVGLRAGGNELERIADIAPHLAADTQTVYAASAANRLAALSFGGEARWERPLGSLAGVDVDAELVYLTDLHSEVHGLNVESGASVWRQDALRARQMTAPTLFGEAVVVADLDGYVHFLGADDGELIARERLSGARITEPALVVAGLAILQDSKGRVRAYRLEPVDGD
jgi:outer membrane protein assembly factor BamB